jgi:protein phosphatase
MTHQLRFAARSDRGLLRSTNQDSVYAGERLLIVADGMGGHAAGDLASRVVVAAFVPLDENPPGPDLIAPLRRAMDGGNDAIADLVAEDPELDGMGTTATAMLFDGPRMGLAHIGDSRAYLYRNGVLHQLSHDDTFVQSLVDDGRITEDEAAHHPQRNLLLRALNGSEPEPMLVVREISVGDRFLICSDGLSGVVSAEAIADTLAGADTDRVADTLIELALIGGGPDNVTVIVADVLDVGPEPAGVPAGVDPEDPEATGPILPIHMTQRMPRVPLPVLSDEEAAERAAAQEALEGYDPDDDDDQDAGDGPVSPPDRPRWRRRTALVLASVVLLAIVVSGSLLWVRTQYYVGEQDGQVVVFRGVDGSVLGIQLSTVAENSCPGNAAGCVPLELSDLVPAARDQVSAGITAGSLDDARSVMQRLSGQMLPTCASLEPTPTVAPITTPDPTPTPSSTGVTPTSPSPSSSAPTSPSPSGSAPTATAPTSRTPPATTPIPTAPTGRSAATATGRTATAGTSARATQRGAAASSANPSASTSGVPASDLASEFSAAVLSAASAATAVSPSTAPTGTSPATSTPTTTSAVVPPATTSSHVPVAGVDCR